MTCAICASRAAAEGPSVYLERLRKFDISCNIFDEKFQKKETGLEHRRAFTALIGLPDREKTLEALDEEKSASQSRLKKIEAALESVAAVEEEIVAVDEETERRRSELAAKAQNGDAAALSELKSLGPAAIPALLQLKDAKATVPSSAIVELLSRFEVRADEAMETEDPDKGLSLGTLNALAAREKSYQAILKRAAIALEGPRRPFPHWLPFLYLYGLGFIPFLFGIIASRVYYEGYNPRAAAVIAGSFVFYVCLIGFFQFFAPWMG